MRIKIQGSELSRMMKTISQCIDSHVQSNNANIEICHQDNMLTIYASNGIFSAKMCTPLLGGDGERFCVDGAMFGKIVSMCNKDTEIITDDKFCTVKCSGRTKLPIVRAKITEIKEIKGKATTISSDNLRRVLGGLMYAVGQDHVTRLTLTAINMEAGKESAQFVALDGFQVSVEHVPCKGDEFKALIPNEFMKLVSQAADFEDVTFITDGHKVQAKTDTMLLGCGLITGSYVDYNMFYPKEFKTECKINVEDLRSALKSGSVVNNKLNTVKLSVSENYIRVMNNSNEAEYEADVPCETQGDGLNIAFNMKYMIGTINSVQSDEAVLKFTTPVSPCVIVGKDMDGFRLLLPVRVFQGG